MSINILFNLLKSGKYNKFKKVLNNLDPHKINIKDDNHNYLITYAIIRNNIEIIKLLLNFGAKIDILDQEGKTILYIPIKYGYDDILTIILNKNPNLVDLKDSNNNIPLHYAINYKNIFAINTLLNKNSDTNIIDNNGNTSIHLSVYTKNYDITEIIIKDGVNINAQTTIGESALHIACNLKLENIAKLLLINNIDPNLQDLNNEITALMYTIYLHDTNLFKLLLKYDANPNIQDSMGNNSLHHVIIEDSDELLFELIESKKQILNFNIHNIDGKLPVHLLLEQTIKENDNTKYIISQSNLNYQDNNGNTSLHFICKKHLWKFLKDVIIKKKLNIFVANYNKIRPIDYVSKHDIKDFFGMIAISYLNMLKNMNFSWTHDWENICNKELHYDKLDKKELKIMNKYISKLNKKEELCYQIITNKLYDIYETCEFCEKCSNCANYSSYPIKQGGKCIKIEQYEQIEMCHFVGLSIDVLIGLLYLLNKHSNACSTLTTNFIKNDDLCSYLSVMGFETNTKCEFMNFEIVWIYKKLFFSENFETNFKKCIDNKKIRFVIIPLGIEIPEGSHANYIIFDKQTYELERFEPYGSNSPSNYDYNEHLLDSILSFKFNEIYNIKYISPSKYLPKISFQYLDVYERKTKKIGDPGGFCALWSIWYTDMRLTYPDYDRKILADKLLKDIRSEGLSFKNLIRNYSLNITNVRDDIFKAADLNINNWMNDEYTEEQYKIVIDKITDMLKSHV